MIRRVVIALTMLGAAVVAAQQPSAIDEQRSAWRYRRVVTLPPESEGRLLAVPVPPEVQSRSQQGLRDLRVVDDTGREAPFIVHEDTARRGERRWTGQLEESQQERRRHSSWTVDFGAIVSFDRLVLDVPGTDFSKRLTVEVSEDGETWRVVGTHFWVFDRPWQSQAVHDTTLDVGAQQARVARLTADDTRTRPIRVQGVVAVQTDDFAGSNWSADVALERLGSANGRTRYRVPVPDGHPVRRMALDADDPAFARSVTVIERRGDEERPAGSGLVYRLRLPDDAADIDAREIDVTREMGGSLVVELADGDNPPLANPRVRLSGPRTVLVASTTARALTLYYGNTVTRPAVYDLERLRTALVLVPDYPLATLGPESENPRFRQPAPLAFVAARGASIDSRAWRFARPVRVSGGDDLYTMVVRPADVARLRGDLGDLRLVDGADRQVPYVLERDADTAQVDMGIEPARPRQGRRQTSAYRIASHGPDPLRLSAVRLQFAEAFFRRNGVVLLPRAGAPLGADQVASSVLTVPRREATGEPVWIEVPLGIVEARELVLEIDDGDNAPLTLRQAQGVAPVPRVTFKATPGDYRLLMGNPEAGPPSYELGALAQEVLAYSAVPLMVEDPQDPGPNPTYERGVRDVIRDAPPTLVLWGALGVAVAVLLGLTRRILKRTS